MALNIKTERTKNPKVKPDGKKLGFGKYFTDHMFVMDYTAGKGWHDARIVPYGSIPLDPSSMILHYGQEIFEGLKAYKTKNGITLFRPEKNIQRMNNSNDRLCIPKVNEEDALQAIKAIVDFDSDWIPTEEGTSLYIRPFIFANEPALGVHPAHNYMFMIILSPVGAYYPEGINPVKIYVETKYVRAVKGGMGYAKTCGNYAASIKAQDEAEKIGYTQVLWLDGVHRKYIEEVGTMNVFFKIDGEVITPALQGSILPGVTRDSAIRVLKSKGYKMSERELSIDEVCAAFDSGKLEEAFGTGTAAVISPIGELNYNGKIMTIGGGKIGKVTQELYDTITGIQWGKIPDNFNWIVKVK